MAWEWVAQVAPAAATLVTAAFGLGRGQGKIRRNLKHDAEVVATLPEASEVRKTMLDHMDWQAGQLAERESFGKREWAGVVVAIGLAIGSGYLSIWLFQHQAWWRWVALVPALLFLVSLYGLVDSLTIKRRAPRSRK
jgi:hypothetical protein